MIPVVESVHQDEATGRCCSAHFLGLCSVSGHGFFAEHMLASRQRLQAPLVVGCNRQRDIDSVNAVISDHLIIVIKHPSNVVCFGKALGPRSVPGSN